ncbi:type II toxin-antitoxin system VapC family toxin [Candidatus Bathyarchaeota archaeon]|nr:type II toxin-antitoxin system VapC family toxin [Candidatus Bathyarchaeota archaeon]
MPVVDASVIAAVILREEGWEKLIRGLKNAITLDQAFKEVSNAIWKAFGRGYLSRDGAVKAFNLLKSIMEVLDVRNEVEYMDGAFKISLETGLTIYDSLYLALARSEKKQLLTLDEGQKTAAEKLNIPIALIEEG